MIIPGLAALFGFFACIGLIVLAAKRGDAHPRDAGPASTATAAPVALPDGPAAMDSDLIAAVVAPVRRAAKAQALTLNGCLGRAAAPYAQHVADALERGIRPPEQLVGMTGCAMGLRSGFIVGPDPTGVSQARVCLRAVDGSSSRGTGLLDPAARQVGYGMAVERVAGRVIGYVLSWAVAA